MVQVRRAYGILRREWLSPDGDLALWRLCEQWRLDLVQYLERQQPKHAMQATSEATMLQHTFATINHRESAEDQSGI
eukprot:3668563-Amphidinium_carterae.1